MASDGTLYNITDVSDGGIWNGPSSGSDNTDIPLRRPGDVDTYADQANRRWGQYEKEKQDLEDQYPMWKRVLGSIGAGMRAYGGEQGVKKPGPDLSTLNAKYTDIMGQARQENQAQNAYKRSEMMANAATNREIQKQNIIGRYADQRQAAKNKAMMDAVNAKITAAKAANGGKPLTSDQYLTQVLQAYTEAGGFGDAGGLGGMNALLNVLANVKSAGAAGNREILGQGPLVPPPAGSVPATPVPTAPAAKPGILTSIFDAVMGKRTGEPTPAPSTPVSAPPANTMPTTAEQAQAAGWKLQTLNGKSGYVDPTGQYVLPVQ